MEIESQKYDNNVKNKWFVKRRLWLQLLTVPLSVYRSLGDLCCVCFSPLTPSVQASKPEVWCFCPLCVHNKLWPAFSRWCRLCQTEGAAATTVWNANGKFKGFSSVWEAAMCQHAALSIKVTLCACVISLPACFLKHLNPKANYRKIHSNTGEIYHSSALVADQRKCENIC